MKSIKNKKTQKNGKSIVCRNPEHIYKDICKRGHGDYQRGLVITNHICKETEKDPANIIMNDVDKLMIHVKQYYPGNHFSHFSNFPAFMTVFLKKGRLDFVDFEKFFGVKSEDGVGET